MLFVMIEVIPTDRQIKVEGVVISPRAKMTYCLLPTEKYHSRFLRSQTFLTLTKYIYENINIYGT